MEQTKQLEKEAKEKRTEPPKTSSIVYYNDETKEISTFTKMLPSYVSIHLYNDEDDSDFEDLDFEADVEVEETP